MKNIRPTFFNNKNVVWTAKLKVKQNTGQFRIVKSLQTELV